MKKEFAILSKQDFMMEGKYNLTDLYKLYNKNHKWYLEQDIVKIDNDYIIRLHNYSPIGNDSILPAINKTIDTYGYINELVYNDKFFNEYKDCYNNGILNNKDNQYDIIIKEYMDYFNNSQYIKLLNPSIWTLNDLNIFTHKYKQSFYLILPNDNV